MRSDSAIAGHVPKAALSRLSKSQESLASDHWGSKALSHISRRTRVTKTVAPEHGCLVTCHLALMTMAMVL